MHLIPQKIRSWVCHYSPGSLFQSLIDFGRHLFLALFCLALTACSTLSIGDEIIPLDVVGYNHTDHSVGTFSVNGGGGGFTQAHHQSGNACCIGVPRDYRADMTVTIRYTDELRKNPQERVVTVPPYKHEDLGHFEVHFLKDGQIKVLVTSKYPGHPDYPLKGDEAKL